MRYSPHTNRETVLFQGRFLKVVRTGSQNSPSSGARSFPKARRTDLNLAVHLFGCVFLVLLVLFFHTLSKDDLDSLGVYELGAGEDHDVRLMGRTMIEITGVEKVSSFDVHAFELLTTAGILHIDGDALHMKHFDMNAGEVRIEGRITALQYEDGANRKRLVGRLLR